MSTKINVGIIFGGKSAEHEVSVRSAQSIIDAIDREKYNPVLIGIRKDGRWTLVDKTNLLSEALLAPLSLEPESSGQITSGDAQSLPLTIDVAFPILHGPFGEDGTVQGLLKLANIPFVGAGVLGSAVGMDKDVMKRLLREANLPIGKFRAIRQSESVDFNTIATELGLPLFVKPANLGSSIGVSKVANKQEFKKALEIAFAYDRKVLVEEYISGREIECSVLGNDKPIASLPGEVVPDHEFYSYEARYIDEHGALLRAPVELPEEITTKIQTLAVSTFQVLCCEGLARVDFFLQDNGHVIINEINTLPGFTSISMYPKLWEASGIPYSNLIDQLIQLAIERFNAEQVLLTSHSENS